MTEDMTELQDITMKTPKTEKQREKRLKKNTEQAFIDKSL